MSEPNSDYGEQPTVVTYCYGTVPSGVIFGALTHVTDDLNLIWTRYAVEGLPNLVQAIPVPPLVDGAATLPPEAGIPTTVPVLGTTVVDGAAETLPAEGTLPPESSLPQDTEVEGPAETLAPEAGLPTVPPQDTSG
jgi:hypothetical protein